MLFSRFQCKDSKKSAKNQIYQAKLRKNAHFILVFSSDLYYIVLYRLHIYFLNVSTKSGKDQSLCERSDK